MRPLRPFRQDQEYCHSVIINLIDFTVATRRTVNITFINDLSIWIFVQVVIHHILHIIVDDRSSSKIDHWFANSAPDSLPLNYCMGGVKRSYCCYV